MAQTAGKKRGQQEQAVRTEASPKWVRARVGGTFVAESRRARLVWIDGMLRTYAFPLEDVRRDLFAGEGERRAHGALGEVRDVDLDVDGRRVRHAMRVPGARAAESGLERHVLVRWDAMDAWYEESEEVHVHPHDPHHRIDVLRSSRHVVVEVEGVRVAESRRPTLLFETGLPVRYYLPQTDVRLDLLRESDTTTGCPYKGFASYRHLELESGLHEDLVWTYTTPLPEGLGIRGLFCFYNERVDLTVDGAPEARPPAA